MMDETEFDDSDFEEIQLFVNSNSVSPANSEAGNTSKLAIKDVKSDDSRHFRDASRTTVSQDSETKTQSQAGADIIPGKTSDLVESEPETTALHKSDHTDVSSKRDLESPGDAGIMVKKRKLDDSVKLGSENSEGYSDQEVQNSKLEHGTKNHDKTDIKQALCKPKTEVTSQDDGQHTGTSPNNVEDLLPKANTNTKNAAVSDCPPIAIVSPLSEQKSHSNSPDNEFDKLGFDKDDEAALMCKLDDFDPSIMDDFPCSIDEMVDNILSDKNDTFQTLDGSSWTFPDLQQIDTDEVKQPVPSEVNKETEDKSHDSCQSKDSVLRGMLSVIKEEPTDSVEQKQCHNQTKPDTVPFQNHNAVPIVKTEPNVDTCQQGNGGVPPQSPTSISNPVKGEFKLPDCSFQEKSLQDFVGQYNSTYAVSTERITPPRLDPTQNKSGFEGLIRQGPPNRVISDLKMQQNQGLMQPKPGQAQGNPPRQRHAYPALNSMNQNIYGQTQNPPTSHLGPIMPWPGGNNQHVTPGFNRATRPNGPGPNPVNMGMQQNHLTRTSPKLPWQPNVHPPFSPPPTSSQHVNQFNMWDKKANFQRSRSTGSMDAGFTSAIRNSHPVNIPQPHQPPIPHPNLNRPVNDNAMWKIRPNSRQFKQSEFGAMLPHGSQPSKLQPPYQSNTRIPMSQNNFGGQTLPNQCVSGQKFVSGYPTDQRKLTPPYHRSQPQVTNMFGQPTNFGSQRSSPRQVPSPSFSQGNNLPQLPNSFPGPPPSFPQTQHPQFPRATSPLIPNQGQSIMSQPWQNSQNRIGKVAMATAPPNQSVGGFHGYNMNNAGTGQTFTQFPASPSLPSIRQKLMEVIHISKSSRSERVRSMANHFVKRVVHVKQSNLNVEEKQNFIMETKTFIDNITKIMDEDSRNPGTATYMDNHPAPPSPAGFAAGPPMKNQPDNWMNTSMADFMDNTMSQSTNPARQSQFTNQFEPFNTNVVNNVTSNNQLSAGNGQASTWNLDTVPDLDHETVKGEPGLDLNPLERFVM